MTCKLCDGPSLLDVCNACEVLAGSLPKIELLDLTTTITRTIKRIAGFQELRDGMWWDNDRKAWVDKVTGELWYD